MPVSELAPLLGGPMQLLQNVGPGEVPVVDIDVLEVPAATLWLMLPPPPPEQADEKAELSATSATIIEVRRLSIKPSVECMITVAETS